jgi:hypothetical protein
MSSTEPTRTGDSARRQRDARDLANRCGVGGGFARGRRPRRDPRRRRRDGRIGRLQRVAAQKRAHDIARKTTTVSPPRHIHSTVLCSWFHMAASLRPFVYTASPTPLFTPSAMRRPGVSRRTPDATVRRDLCLEDLRARARGGLWTPDAACRGGWARAWLSDHG